MYTGAGQDLEPEKLMAAHSLEFHWGKPDAVDRKRDEFTSDQALG